MCPSDHRTAPIIAFHDVSKSVDRAGILRHISMSILPGEVVGLLGPSGAGKSTILRCIDLLTGITSGEIAYQLEAAAYTVRSGNVVDIATGGLVDPTIVRRSIGMVFQHLLLWPERSVLSNLTLAPTVVYGESRASVEARAYDYAARFGVNHKLKSNVRELSGGERQRVALVRALMMKPAILLLDEVTSALDPLLTASVMDAIRLLRGDGMTMIVVTHHVEFAASICDRVLFIKDGLIIEEATIDNHEICAEGAQLRTFLSSIRAAR